MLNPLDLVTIQTNKIHMIDPHRIIRRDKKRKKSFFKCCKKQKQSVIG